MHDFDEWPWPELPLPVATSSIADPVAPVLDDPPHALVDPALVPTPTSAGATRALPSWLPVGADEELRGRRQALPTRGDSGRWLDAHLLEILAVAAAAPAVAVPASWVLVCSIAALAMLAVSSARAHVGTKGSADVVVVPGRVAGRLVLGIVNPVNWLKVLLGALAALTFGILGSATVAAGQWLLRHGTDGILAAVRAGVWAHALTWAALAACVLLLRGVGRTHDRRAAALRRVTRRLPELAVAGVAVCAVALGVMATIAGPAPDLAFVHDADGLGWVPAGLRADVDGLRDDVVREEIDDVASCMSGEQPKAWTASYTDANPLDDPDIARFTADPTRLPDQATVAAVALAAHNHLAPWVEAIEIAVGPDVVLAVDRRGLPRAEPLTDAGLLRGHAAGTPDWLVAVAPTVDADRVLTCSARVPV
jgi:hypothetical protein